VGKNVGKYADMAVSKKKKNPQPVAITEVEDSLWWMIRGSNPGHPAGLETTLYLLIIYYFL
jgi:hypothetical protein